MNPPRLAHAFVFTVDVERMAAFYERAFGMRRENSSDAGFVIMRAGAGADVAIHGVPPHIAAQITDPDGNVVQILRRPEPQSAGSAPTPRPAV